MNEKLEEYRENFDEQFPMMMVLGMSDEDIVSIIDKCLESGKPYEPDFDEGTVY